MRKKLSRRDLIKASAATLPTACAQLPACWRESRSISTVMERGLIIDTVVNGLAVSLSGLPTAVAALGMMGAQAAILDLKEDGSALAGDLDNKTAFAMLSAKYGGSTFYVGSTQTGAIYAGSLRTGAGQTVQFVRHGSGRP